MSHNDGVASDEQQDNTEFLRHQLKVRDQLVDQLSAQLFQMVQEHPPALPEGRSKPLDIGTTSPAEDIQALQQQINFYQDQLDQRDQQILNLKSSCQALRNRNQMLEKVVQELPEVYRQQFAERLDRFKEKMYALKMENQQLRQQLELTPNASSAQSTRKLFLPSQTQE